MSIFFDNGGYFMKEKDKFTVIYAEDHDLIAGIGVHENTLSSYNMHTHDCYELELITKGKAKHKLNNKTSVVSEGDLIFVTPMDIHSYEKLDDNFKVLCVLQLRTLSQRFIINRVF